MADLISLPMSREERNFSRNRQSSVRNSLSRTSERPPDSFLRIRDTADSMLVYRRIAGDSSFVQKTNSINSDSEPTQIVSGTRIVFNELEDSPQTASSENCEIRPSVCLVIFPIGNAIRRSTIEQRMAIPPRKPPQRHCKFQVVAVADYQQRQQRQHRPRSATFLLAASVRRFLSSRTAFF